MSRILGITSALSAVLVAAALAIASPRADEGRVFSFEYRVRVPDVPADQGPLHLFVPLAARTEQQRVLDEQVEASIPGSVGREARYGNRFWHGTLPAGSGGPVEVVVRTVVERRVSRVAAPVSSRGMSPPEREALAGYLTANERVPVGHPVLDPIRAEVRERAGSDDPTRVARAIYDWVVDNVEYKKVGTGWGNGDTFWACNERYGNCTDFHSLFISLARSEGIPARFEIGFPVPEDRPSGRIAGYHCWVELWLPETGWFPIDASEAFKHPERRDFYYGAHPGDRIHFSTGRDLALGAGHVTRPLNYFVDPHVEVAGARFPGVVETSYSYSRGP